MLHFKPKFAIHTFAAGLAGAGLLASTSLSAQGDLLVAPTRVIIDNRGTAQVILDNIGSTEATYRISATLMRMTEEGNLVPVEEAQENQAEKDALEMVRFAPRRVVLPPGQPQLVRVSARPGADIPDGEYRIHLKFNGLPKVTTVEDQAEDQASGKLSFHLIPIYSISIPVIVRKGNLEAAATISNPRIVQNGNGTVLKLEMARNGTASVFGEIRIMKPGKSDPVFLAKGIAIYPEITHREVDLPLSPEQVAELKGQYTVEYRELPENGGSLLASTQGSQG